MNRLVMRLFIAGRSVRSDAALENLNSALGELNHKDYDLSVVDVLQDPQQAEDEFILATPTLVKYSPEPQRRTIGDLSDKVSLRRGLGL